MIPSKIKSVFYELLPFSIAICILVAAAFGVGLSMGLGTLQNFIYDDPSAGGWAWILAIPLSIPALFASLPWSQELLSIGETLSIVVGVLINGFIGLIIWRIYRFYKKET